MINTKLRGRIPGTKASIAKSAAPARDAPQQLWRQAQIGGLRPRPAFATSSCVRGSACLLPRQPLLFRIEGPGAPFRSGPTDRRAAWAARAGSKRAREGMGALSTTICQPTATSSWKQEVSRRVAAHQSRRGDSAAQPATPALIRQNLRQSRRPGRRTGGRALRPGAQLQPDAGCRGALRPACPGAG